MDDMQKLRRRAFARDSRFLTLGTMSAIVIALCVMVLALLMHGSLRFGWLLWLAGIAALAAVLIFTFALARYLGGESASEPHLLKRARNEHYIAGPPAAVAKSLVPSVALVAYGAWALVVGEAWVLYWEIPFVFWWEGLECRLYGAGCASLGGAIIFRFHTRWRRSHLGFGILIAVALVTLCAAVIVWDYG